MLFFPLHQNFVPINKSKISIEFYQSLLLRIIIANIVIWLSILKMNIVVVSFVRTRMPYIESGAWQQATQFILCQLPLTNFWIHPSLTIHANLVGIEHLLPNTITCQSYLYHQISLHWTSYLKLWILSSMKLMQLLLASKNLKMNL